MKPKIHPEYKEVTVSCACGEEFVTRSTKSELRLEICSKCHPFFTGQMKIVDTAGRVERFERREQAAVLLHVARQRVQVTRPLEAGQQAAVPDDKIHRVAAEVGVDLRAVFENENCRSAH